MRNTKKISEVLSWKPPRSVIKAEFLQPKLWIIVVISPVVTFVIFEWMFRRRPPTDISSPELGALIVAACMFGFLILAQLYLFFMLRPKVVLTEEAVLVYLLGKNSVPKTYAYQSICHCRIEPSRLVPSLLCLAFTISTWWRKEKWIRLELAPEIDPEVVRGILNDNHVECADRTIS
jgi:hypothetical protein